MHSTVLWSALIVVAAPVLAAARPLPGEAAGPTALQGHAVQALVSAGGQVIAGTDAGVFLRSSDGSWTPAAGPAGGVDATSLAVVTGVVAAGTDNGVITSRDGRTWSAPTLTGRRVDALVAAGSSLIAGTGSGSGADGTVFRSDDQGTTWTPATTAPALEGLPGPAIQALGLDVAGVLAGTAGNGVFRSADARSTWAATGGGPGYVTAITSLGGAGAQTLAATDDGLFSTNPGGTQWTIEPFPQLDPWIQALAVDGGDVLAGTYDGGLYRRSGGAWSTSLQGLPSILSLLPAGGGAVLIGTFDGVYCSGCASAGSGTASGSAASQGAVPSVAAGASRSAPPVAARPGVPRSASTGAAASSPGATSSAAAGATASGGSSSAAPPGISASTTSSGRGAAVWIGAAILALLTAGLFVYGRWRMRNRPN